MASRIVSQVAWSYVSWGLIFVTGPLSLALLTRTLSVHEFGIYSLLVIVIRVLPRALSLGVPAYLTRTFAGRPTEELRRALGSLLPAIAAITAVVLAAAFAIVRATGILDRGELGPYPAEIAAALVAVTLGVALQILRGFFYANRRVALSHLLSLLDERLWLVPVVALVLMGRLTLLGLFVTWSAGTVATLVVGLMAVGRAGLEWRVDRAIVRPAIAYGVPLLPFVAGVGSLWLVDRYVLSFFTSAAAVAQFSVAQSISLMVAAMGAVLHGALFPHLSASRVRQDDSPREPRYRRMFTLSTKYTMLIVVPLTLGVFAVRGPLISAISGPGYATAAELLPGLLAVAVLNALIQLVVQDLMLQDATRTVAAVFGSALAAHVAVSLALVPRYGATGSVLAGVVTHLVMLVAAGWCARAWRLVDGEVLRPARIGLATGAMLAALLWAGAAPGWSLPTVVATGAVAYVASLLLSGAVRFTELSQAWQTTADLS